jgi:hypothetical protein
VALCRQVAGHDEAEWHYADRWQDMTKLILAFPNFANAPNNEGAPKDVLCSKSNIDDY